ncbi:MAG: LacI family DNA-binding transcriptional regulator [Planctomycetota bacterium]|jgi:DNA-binding LacI/PurR family transcriptional regulator|nr:LacI family DNA-binding transcriptional regulator [Planctomycetota bacterium]
MLVVKIADIAQRAGVSPATVSQVLNGKYKENRPSMQARAAQIRELAAEMGYKPNAAARSIVRGRFNAISLLIDYGGWGQGISRHLLGEVMAVLNEVDMQLTVTQVPRSVDGEGQAEIFKQRCVDGLLTWFTTGAPQLFVDRCAAERVPSVFLNTKLPRDCIYPDDLGAARKLTQCFLEQGLRRIAYVGQDIPAASRHYSVDDRLAGYLGAMHDAKRKPLVVAPSRVGDELGIHDYINRCLEDFKPEAVICYGGLEESVVTAPWYRGCPIGFFTSASHIYFQSPHWVMRTPDAHMGREGVRALLRKIKTGRSFASQAIPFELTVRPGTSLRRRAPAHAEDES